LCLNSEVITTTAQVTVHDEYAEKRRNVFTGLSMFSSITNLVSIITNERNDFAANYLK